MGVPFEQRGKRMDEQLPVIQKLLAGEVVSAEGEFYRFDALRISPLPTEKVPMWVGGMNKAPSAVPPSSATAGPGPARRSSRRSRSSASCEPAG